MRENFKGKCLDFDFLPVSCCPLAAIEYDLMPLRIGESGRKSVAIGLGLEVSEL